MYTILFWYTVLRRGLSAESDCLLYLEEPRGVLLVPQSFRGFCPHLHYLYWSFSLQATVSLCLLFASLQLGFVPDSWLLLDDR